MVFSLACLWIKCDWLASSSYHLLPRLLCHYRSRLWGYTPNKSFLLKLSLFIIFLSQQKPQNKWGAIHPFTGLHAAIITSVYSPSLTWWKILYWSRHKNTDTCFQLCEIKSVKPKPYYTEMNMESARIITVSDKGYSCKGRSKATHISTFPKSFQVTVNPGLSWDFICCVCIHFFSLLFLTFYDRNKQFEDVNKFLKM